MTSDTIQSENATGAVTQESLAQLDTFAQKRLNEEAHAELIEGMPPLLERAVVYVVAAALLITLAILYFGKVDVVVETKGKVLPQGNVISLPAGHGGVVLELRAAPGDHLPAGAVIAVIDTSDTGISLAQSKRKLALDEKQLELQRATLLQLDRLLAAPRPSIGKTKGQPAIAPSAYQMIHALENAEIRLDGAEGEQRLLPERIEQLRRELDLIEQRIAMLERSRTNQKRALEGEAEALDRRREQLQSVRKLAEGRLLSVVELNTEEERFRAAETALMRGQEQLDQLEIETSNAKLRRSEVGTRLDTLANEAAANLRAARAQYDQALASLRQERENVVIQARGLEGEIEGTGLQINLGEHRLALANVTMPVAGTLADLKIRTTGEIVAAGASVATIVPEGVALMVEATVPDKDVGFVRAGTPARVKIDAFPYQQFGTIPARVTKVLPGFSEGTGFRVQLALLDDRLRAEGSEYRVFPGLSVTADLITNRQRLLSVLLKSGEDQKATPR